MRWEKVEIPGNGGPGKRWGHTCNAIDGGKRFYVIGGYGKSNCQTNEVHVFDTGEYSFFFFFFFPWVGSLIISLIFGWA